MEEKKTHNAEIKTEKLSYEQLENVAHQLSEQNKKLYTKLQEINMVNAFKRLDCLFKVVENASNFNQSFYSKCVDEIENLMTIPEQDIEKEEKVKE